VTDGVGEDVVMKLRRAAPQAQPSVRGLAMELDVLPDAAIWSTSLKRRLGPGQVQESIGRRNPARHLLSPAQRTLLLTAAGDGIDIAGLVVLGPVNVVRLTSEKLGNHIDLSRGSTRTAGTLWSCWRNAVRPALAA
jgi:hypothetical protein